MNEINKYEILEEFKLNQDFIKNIKLLYVFEHYWNKINVIIVTKDDVTYVFGNNINGVLGFGHRNVVKEPTLNKELSNKQIVDLKNSFYHTVARTIDGKVYCWGWNECGVLGNGEDDEKTYKPQLNEYLSDKNIVDICCGWRHSLVLTIDGQVYAWGSNLHGQIGNERNDVNVSIPYHVNGFNGEKIKAIACGYNYSMALTEKGNVFSWGRNDCGQLGSKRLKEYYSISVPKLIEINEVFEKISCGPAHSLLLSRNGDIYVFGSNKSGQLGDEKIIDQSEIALKLRNENKFIDIASHYRYSISVALSKKGIILIWGQCGKEVIQNPIKTQFKNFDEVFTHYFQITYKTMVIDNKLSVDGDLEHTLNILWAILANSTVSVPLRPQISTLVVTPKNDAIDQIKFFVNSKIRYGREFKESEDDILYNFESVVSFADSKEIDLPKLNGRPISHKLKNEVISDINSNIKHNFSTEFQHSSDFEERAESECTGKGRYSKEFIEQKFIASGSFGIVFKAKNKRDNKLYAIKKVPISEPLRDNVIKEIEILSNLKSDFVVKLESFWTEYNYIQTNGYNKYEYLSASHNVFDPHNPLLLHIQMELCCSTLEQGMIKLNSELNQKQNQIMSPLGYYISCKLFIEILEAVDFLHKQNPQIIHRDLKPTNILISRQKNNKFIKLADFGLATIHEFDGQSHTKYKGTREYRAPEVSKTSKYDTKADIYSLGVITEELFNFDINNESIGKNTDLENNYLNLIRLIEKMTSRQKNNRPNCEQILNERDSWAFSLNESKLNSEDINNILKKVLL